MGRNKPCADSAKDPNASSKSNVPSLNMKSRKNQVGSRDLLLCPSHELKKTKASLLSARGTEHRSRDQFSRNIRASSETIRRFGPAHKGSSTALFQRAYTQERLGNLDKATADYTQLIQRQPTQAKAFFNRANIKAQSNNLDGALKDMEMAVKLEPDNESFLANRALLYRKQGKYMNAVSDILGTRELQQVNKLKQEEKQAQIRESKAKSQSRWGLLSNLSHATRGFKGAGKGTLASSGSFNNASAQSLGSSGSALPSPQHNRKRGLQQMMDGNKRAEQLRMQRQHEVEVHLDTRDYASAWSLAKSYELTGFLEDKFWEASVSRRDEGHCHQLAKTLKGLRYFDKLPAEIAVQLCGSLTKKHFSQGEYIVNQGEYADCFHVVYRGSVSLTKKTAANLDEEETETKLLQLYSGDAFGDTELRKGDGCREVSVVAEQDVEVLELEKRDYEDILQAHENTLAEERLEMLHQSPVFQDWDKPTLYLLAKGAIIKNFNGNQKIMTAGEEVTHLCYIMSGVCRVVKQITLPAKYASPTKENVPLEKLPGYWVMNYNKPLRKTQPEEGASKPAPKPWGAAALAEPRKKDVTVALLTSGQVFGELAVIDPHGHSHTSVYTDTRVDVLMVSKSDLADAEAQFFGRTVRCLQDSHTLHNPPDGKVLDMFNERRQWTKQRKRVLKEVM
jgi:CRP-like cAMP-binding protein/Flp pilus assembly protein TadD